MQDPTGGSKRSTKANWSTPHHSSGEEGSRSRRPFREKPRWRHGPRSHGRSGLDSDYRMSLPRETREASQTREDRERETKETWETFETLESGPESGEFATFPDHHEHGREHGMALDGLRQAAQGLQEPQGEVGAARGVRSKEMDSPEHPELNMVAMRPANGGNGGNGANRANGVNMPVQPQVQQVQQVQQVPHVHHVHHVQQLQEAPQVQDVPQVPGVVETDFADAAARPHVQIMESVDTENLDLDEILGSKTGSKSSPVRNSFTDSGWEKSVVRILELLETHSKFKKTAFRSRRRFFNNLFLSGRLAMWMVILSGPVIVWPVAEYFNSLGERSSKYMASYGMAMSNFCFLLSPNVGMGIRYALEGVIGTLLALGNMLLLNRAFGTWMQGGAYATREEFVDPNVADPIYRSEWLPLCNLGNGARFITTNSTQEFLQQCFMNVHWSSMTDGGIRSAIVLLDLALFTAVFLGVAG